jgi:hypothetical protein
LAAGDANEIGGGIASGRFAFLISALTLFESDNYYAAHNTRYEGC